MDDRRRRIDELERKKRENAALLDVLLIRLGEALFSRITNPEEENSALEELAAYRRFQKDIANSQASIQVAEEQIRRFRELEDNIQAKERDDNSCTREISSACSRLGKLILDSPGYDEEFCSPYRSQADALLNKVLSLEDRLGELEHRDGGNVFTWIGKSAQGLVLRSFFTKAQENLEQLHRTVGDRYSRQNTGKHNDISPEKELMVNADEIQMLCANIEKRRSESRVLQQELMVLKEEKRIISGAYSAEGSPHKHIQSLKNHIAHVRDDLKALYRRIGVETISIDVSVHDTLVERRHFIESLIEPQDRETLENAAKINQAIRDDESVIEKLQASLSIDDEMIKIDKYRKMIQEKMDKIAQAERHIEEFERNIRDSEETIEKLKDLL